MRKIDGNIHGVCEEMVASKQATITELQDLVLSLGQRLAPLEYAERTRTPAQSLAFTLLKYYIDARPESPTGFRAEELASLITKDLRDLVEDINQRGCNWIAPGQPTERDKNRFVFNYFAALTDQEHNQRMAEERRK